MSIRPTALVARSLLATPFLTAGAASLVAQEAPVALDPVTVTATGNPMAAFEYPGQVSVVDREELERLVPSSADDVLRRVPGVESSGGPRRTGEVPSIRGFSGADVTVLFDGVRQNFNAGHDGRFFIDPALLRSVEVVKGPTSALYGSGGLGGTIAFETLEAADLLRPGDTMGARVGTGYRTANGENSYHATGFGTAGGADILASVGYRDAGSIELGDGSLLDENERLGSGLVKGGYAGLEDHLFELSWLGYRGDVVEPANPQGAGSGGRADKDITSDTLRGAWRWNPADNELLDLGVTLSWARNEVEEDMRTGNRATLTRELETTGIRLDNRSRMMHAEGLGTLLTYGVELFRDEQTGRDSTSADGTRSGVPDAEATTMAGFVQAEITWDSPFGTPGSWLLVPGLRYDRFENEADGGNSIDDSHLSPKVALSYMPTDWLMVFGSYAEAFRAPTMDELYADGVHFSVPGFGSNFFTGNPDLKSQKTKNWEVGSGLRFEDVLETGDLFSLKGSWFWIEGDDFINLEVNQPAPPACFPPNCNGTTQAVNVADAELSGMEIEGGYENRRIIARVGYSTLDGEDEETGRPLGVLQPNRLNTELAFKIHEIDTLVGWRGTFAGRLDRADPGEERDAYQVHDLFASWAPLEGPLEGVRVDAGIENIFDKTYTRVATDAVEEGRNYRLGVSYTIRW